MNKEVKELIEQLEEYASGGGSGLYPFEESVKALLDYINQLETNRDEAIEYIKIHRQTYDIDGSIEPKLDDFNILASPKKLISILERGKE